MQLYNPLSSSEFPKLPQTSDGLTRAGLDAILSAAGALRVAIIGDYSLDAYWYVDMTKAELSREAPLFNRPVVRETYSPGAAANVAWNVAALGVAEAHALTVMGDDWRGELLKGVLRRERVWLDHVLLRSDCITPCYGKVMLTAHTLQQEDARLDFSNSCPPSAEAEDALIAAAEMLVPRLNALIIEDQLAEGLITPRVRAVLNALAREHPQVVFVVDSRYRLREFRNMVLKPNEIETAAALFPGEAPGSIALDRLVEAAVRWQQEQGRPIYVTLGPQGCIVVDDGSAVSVPGIAVPAPIDTVGAGDTFISALAVSLAAGASPVEAGTIANLAAAVTVRKLHITGTASPGEIREMYESAKRE